MRIIFFLLFSIFCTAPFFGAGQTDTTAIHEAVSKYVERSGFSGTILVAENGAPVFQESYGLAYYSIPDTIRNDYHYSIASITKLFTSIRILQLVEKQKIDLEESVVHYLPRLASSVSDQVTIHHLLLHISGLPNENDKDYGHPLPPTEFITAALDRKSRSSIGAFNYNNVDYMLLGLIIEKVTQASWQDNITQAILQPLAMQQTGFLRYGYYPRDFAYTYRFKRDVPKQDPLFYIENFYAAGNMYSTAADLLKLDQALYASQLLSEESRRLLSVSYPEFNYAGYSVWNYNYPFVAEQPAVMERRGGILGANVVLVRLPDQNYTIIVLSNDDRFNPDSFGDEGNLREMLIRSLF